MGKGGKGCQVSPPPLHRKMGADKALAIAGAQATPKMYVFTFFFLIKQNY